MVLFRTYRFTFYNHPIKKKQLLKVISIGVDVFRGVAVIIYHDVNVPIKIHRTRKPMHSGQCARFNQIIFLSRNESTCVSPKNENIEGRMLCIQWLIFLQFCQDIARVGTLKIEIPPSRKDKCSNFKV